MALVLPRVTVMRETVNNYMPARKGLKLFYEL